MNLNQVEINADGPSRKLINPSFCDGDISVIFRDLEANLLSAIDQADIVVGCVAWLTAPSILSALSSKKAVALVVQKEDFLRPDSDVTSTDWKANLRRQYENLPSGVNRLHEDVPFPLRWMSCAGDPSVDSVRCVGNYNADKQPAFPRMHNKFIVFCRREIEYKKPDWRIEAPEYSNERIRPYAVWTGSFNFTLNATQSLENALYITRPKIVEAYFTEWSNIEAISELLDWTEDWIAPDWRIGT